MASPMTSMVTCTAAKGKSPSVVLKTRQSCRKSIMAFLQFFDFVNEISRFLEAPINTGVTNIGHGIQPAKPAHHPLANLVAGNFPLERAGKVIDDLLDEIDDFLLADRAFFASLLHTGKELFPGKFLPAAIAFQDHEASALDFLVGGEAVAALQAFASTTNGRAFPRRSRVDDLIVLTTTFRAAHGCFGLHMVVCKGGTHKIWAESRRTSC